MRKAFLGFFLLFICVRAFPLGKTTLYLNHHKIFAEVARTEAEREKGLMDRHFLPLNHGMLFIFHEKAVRYFWMKNTFIPLDIAFLGSKGKILVIKSMKPLDLTPVSSEKPCLYALEMNSGYFKKIHARVGEQVKGIPASGKKKTL